MAVLQRAGHVNKTSFSLVGDNIEWAAPEVMNQNSNFGMSADIYSLGITAMELVYNKTPFDDWPPMKVLLCKQKFECPAIKSTKRMSQPFFRFVQSCVWRDPSQRPLVEDLLDHPFLKQAKGPIYLEQLILNKV